MPADYPMTRRPLFWVALAVLSVAGGAFALRYYAEAFPLLSVDLRMSRAEALDSAARMAEEAGWRPEGFSQAASFRQSDPEVQTYVELEGGGPDAFADLVESGPYRPYAWEVRHFREGEVAETRVRFTPEGRPYGFRETLAEDAPGPELSADEARAVAETDARTRWGVELDAYRSVETSQVARPGGRVDHTFVYERDGPALGDARVRLRLRVAGDRPSELAHFVEVPEAFLRRYQEIRSGNETLALVSSVIFVVGFLVVGCGVATFFLLRGGWILWRAPLAWALAISVLMALGTLNQLPLSWMDYDTAVSRSTFLLQQVGVAVLVVVFGTPFLAFVFMAAESLTRRAFPRQPQQWRLGARDAANSDAVLGRTAGAYLWLGVDLGFVVAFYLLASRLPGWWIPSDTLMDPDLLATPFPWLMALSLSMFAAFWEESLFRAVPLAGAMILGRRFGGVKVWIVAALLLQAIVFAAAHANYPQQPAYARLAELFVPALLWGVFYLYFGLLPVILIHFLHNFSFFSLVLFSASDAGLWPDRFISLALMMTPLVLVLAARARLGAVKELPEGLRNAAWRPTHAGADPKAAGAHAPPVVPDDDADRADALSPVEAARRAQAIRWLIPAGIAGAVLWAVFSDPRPDAPALELGRSEAIRVARDALEERGLETAAWEALASVEGTPGASARFVWETAGPDGYRTLLGSYLRPPQWRVRFVRFDGAVEERAEEWRVAVGPEGGVREVVHRVPEAAEGAELELPDARTLARSTLMAAAGAAPETFREVSAEASQRPARRDWLFTFTPTGPHPIGEGEPRVQVEIAGDEVAAVRRLVHVPEAWEREERRRATRSTLVSLGSAGIGVLVLLASVVAAVVVWSRGRFAARAFVAVTLSVAAIQTVGAANGFPAVVAGFTTAEPLRAQLFAVGAGLVIAGLLLSGSLGLLAGLAHTWLWRSPTAAAGRPFTPGAFAGLALAGALSAATALAPEALGPRWPELGAAGAYLPALQALVEALTAFLAGTTLLLLVVGAVHRWTGGWRRRRGEAISGLLGLGVLLRGTAFTMQGDLVPDLLRWVGGGLLVGVVLALVYGLARRFHPAVVPALAAVVVALGRIEDAFARPYPGSATGAVAGALGVMAAAWLWGRALERRGAETTPGRGRSATPGPSPSAA
jgi:hypothetical protein